MTHEARNFSLQFDPAKIDRLARRYDYDRMTTHLLPDSGSSPVVTAARTSRQSSSGKRMGGEGRAC
jgi:hypothetical protein